MLASLNRHSDYVMALAVAGPTSAPVLASAGLRAEVFLWDVVASMKIYQQVPLTPLSSSQALSSVLRSSTCEPHAQQET